ncbi:efflux RND transporter periplasmic adaptor subunit [Selenomonadales bacterium OttesenSCG-928-I06]|nr:efflux RND transporter periplasmic adaptor subunit [Selenomonadales bacterium OttesenSCG-928-I06]
MFEIISKKSHKLNILLAVVALSCFCLFLITGCSNKQTTVQKVSVKCIEVIQRDTPISREYVGSVIAKEEIQIKSRVTGFITERMVDANYPVKKGQPLFQIDRRTYEAALWDRQASLASAEATLSETRIDVDRYQMLYKVGATSKQQLDQIMTKEERNIASVASNNALVKQAQDNLNDTLITSPIEGRIGLKYLSAGDFVTSGQTVIATVSSIDPVRVKFSLSENEYLELVNSFDTTERPYPNPEDMPINIVLGDGSQYPIEGKLVEADQGLSDTTGTLGIVAEFANPNKVLMPGMFVRVVLVGQERKGALLVPQRAITETLGKNFVMVVNAEGKAESRNVKVGPKYGSFQIIEEGITSSDTVIVEGLTKAKPGSDVAVTMMTPEEISALNKK